MEEIKLRSWCFIDNPYKEDYEDEKSLYIFFYIGEQLCRIMIWEYELTYTLSQAEVTEIVVPFTKEALKFTRISTDAESRAITLEDFFESHFKDADAYKLIHYLVSKKDYSKLKNNKIKF